MGVNLDTFAGVWLDFCKNSAKKSYKGSLTDYICDLVSKNNLDYIDTNGLT